MHLIHSDLTVPWGFTDGLQFHGLSRVVLRIVCNVAYGSFPKEGGPSIDQHNYDPYSGTAT